MGIKFKRGFQVELSRTQVLITILEKKIVDDTNSICRDKVKEVWLAVTLVADYTRFR